MEHLNDADFHSIHYLFKYENFKTNEYLDTVTRCEITTGEIKLRIGKYCIFNPQHVYIFRTEQDLVGIKSYNRYSPNGRTNKKQDIIIDTEECFELFKAGYDSGLKYFEQHYSVPLDMIFTEDISIYVRSLHRLCYHSDNGQRAWNDVKTLFIGSPVDLMELGKLSAFLASIIELKTKYPLQFSDFDTCHYDEAITDIEPASAIKAIGGGNDSLFVNPQFAPILIDALSNMGLWKDGKQNFDHDKKGLDLTCLLSTIIKEVKGGFDAETCIMLAQFLGTTINKSTFSRNNPLSQSREKVSQYLFSGNKKRFETQLKATAKNNEYIFK